MKKIALFVILAISILAFSSCAPMAKEAVRMYEKDKYVFLVAGFDDAAENTDVLFTLAYDSNTGEVRVAQIPRDTYFSFGNVQNKINQIYASKISSGISSKKALQEMSEEIASAFGTKFDGFFGISIKTFKKIIDAIGGVDIELSEDRIINLDDEEPLVLKKGKNHIDGETAERFVRYRSGYAMGDLGRIDAQKIFLNALFSKIVSGIKIPELLKIAAAMEKDVVTDIKLYDALNIFVQALSSKTDKQAFYATVPGEPVESSSGLSFYVLNRKSSAELAKIYMFAEEEFDRERKFLNSYDAKFINIYEDTSTKITEYTNDNISDMHIIPR